MNFSSRCVLAAWPLFASVLANCTASSVSIDEIKAVELANKDFARRIQDANSRRSHGAYPVEMANLVLAHNLRVERYETPENACLHGTLLAGIIANLADSDKAHDEELKQKLRNKKYYLVMYASNPGDFGHDYCFFVDAENGDIIAYDTP